MTTTLSQDLERQLFTEMKYSTYGRRKDARNRLINQYFRLVPYVAKKFGDAGKKDGHEYDDIVGAGFVGLIRAVDRYDSSRGVKFITYAACSIEDEIKKYLMRDGCKVPTWVAEILVKYSKMEDEILKSDGEIPSQDEVMDRLGLEDETRESVAAALAFYKCVSLDEPVSWEDDSERSDVLSADSLTMPTYHDRYPDARYSVVREAIEKLPPRLRTIIELRMEEYEFKEISSILHISAQWVEHLEKEAYTLLRSYVKT
jgi:RNA polymerase sigma factor (sigma-70 family)